MVFSVIEIWLVTAHRNRETANANHLNVVSRVYRFKIDYQPTISFCCKWYFSFLSLIFPFFSIQCNFRHCSSLFTKNALLSCQLNSFTPILFRNILYTHTTLILRFLSYSVRVHEVVYFDQRSFCSHIVPDRLKILDVRTAANFRNWGYFVGIDWLLKISFNARKKVS